MMPCKNTLHPKYISLNFNHGPDDCHTQIDPVALTENVPAINNTQVNTTNATMSAVKELKHGNFGTSPTISPTYNIPRKCCEEGPEKSRRPTHWARGFTDTAQ
jgi:hypothetical protein